MIEFRNVSKYFLTNTSRKVIVDHLDLRLPFGAKVGLLGRNGAGKTTLMAMVAGSVKPASGEIRRAGAISWPLGFGNGFHGALTGAQNVRFVARIYGMDTDALVAYVADFAEIGEFMDMPVSSYSSGMRARVAFGMAMGITFDWYLVDEVTAVGDARFKKKALAVFKSRLKDAGVMMISHSTNTIRSYCTAGIVLEKGRVRYFPDVEEAIAVHEANMATA